MSRLFKKVSGTAGMMPGALVHVGDRKEEKVTITLIDYDHEQYRENKDISIEECLPFRNTPTVTWINVDGLHDIEIIDKFGRYFGLHPLILEDILNTGQRPKCEYFTDNIFVVLKMLLFDGKKTGITSEQVSILIGPDFVISFQEKRGDVFEPVRNRIRKDKGRIRRLGADYLAYALLDAVVDGYFFILEKISENIESVEEGLVASPEPETLKTIYGLKKDIVFLRKSVWPLREVIGSLEREESDLLHVSTGPFLRDLYDHTIQVIDTVETFRDMTSGMLDIYLSSVSNRMNEVMKVLTIIATIFIPVTFIAGIYGMNFNTDISGINMPELNWRFGYVFAWCLMAAVAITMLIYFRRKKWI